LSQGFVPDEMKIARVIPLYKSEDKSFVENYRPVSILPVFSKILEKVFYNRILNYLNKNEILYANQYGFIERVIRLHQPFLIYTTKYLRQVIKGKSLLEFS
jgi:hypothetical protein